MKTEILAALEEAEQGLAALRSNEETIQLIEDAARVLIASFRAGGKVLACGNGGSMSDSMHLAEEFVARFRGTRRSLPALAASDPSFLSCAANDFGYSEVFARFVEGFGTSLDVLVCFSTSGKSENVLKAAETARARGLKVIALTGQRECPLRTSADVHIPTPAGRYADRVQELHIKVVHIFVELVERELFPELYKANL